MGISTLNAPAPAPRQRHPIRGCGFAWPGTFGHECSKPALFVRASASERTVSGWFYAGRCAEHAYTAGGENIGTAAPEPLDPEQHFNEWR